MSEERREEAEEGRAVMAPPCAALAFPSRFSSVTSRPTSCSTFIERESCGAAAVCAGVEERRRRECFEAACAFAGRAGIKGRNKGAEVLTHPAVMTRGERTRARNVPS